MSLLRWTVAGAMCALVVSGCGRKAAPPATPAAKKPAGRLVPAVLAGFERGAGGWKSAPAGVADASMEPPTAQSGGAAKGDRWLAQNLTVAAGETRSLNLYGVVPTENWSRFGDTLRASVRAVPGGAKVTANLYLVGPDGKEQDGPEQPVTGEWAPVVWNAGEAVHDVSRIGVRFTVVGPFRGRLGLDNVRIGARVALAAAWTVAVGPFGSRDKAVDRMSDLKASGVSAFPLYEQGWYLGLGTFSTRKSAQTEAARLDGRGMMTTILER